GLFEAGGKRPLALAVDVQPALVEAVVVALDPERRPDETAGAVGRKNVARPERLLAFALLDQELHRSGAVFQADELRALAYAHIGQAPHRAIDRRLDIGLVDRNMGGEPHRQAWNLGNVGELPAACIVENV